MRNDGDLNLSGSSGNGTKWSNSGCILKREPVRFTCWIRLGWESKGRQYNTEDFGLSNRKKGVAIYWDEDNGKRSILEQGCLSDIKANVPSRQGNVSLELNAEVWAGDWNLGVTVIWWHLKWLEEGLPWWWLRFLAPNVKGPGPIPDQGTSSYMPLIKILLLLLLLSQFSRVRLCATPQTASYQAPLSLGFSRQEY